MLRPEFVRRKLTLIAEDLERLAGFRDVSLEALRADEVRLAAVERMLERIVMHAIDVNEHLTLQDSASTGRTLLSASRPARACATSSCTTTTSSTAASSLRRSPAACATSASTSSAWQTSPMP